MKHRTLPAGSPLSVPLTSSYWSPRLPGLDWDQWLNVTTPPSKPLKSDEEN